MRFRRHHVLAGQQHLERAAAADQPRQPLRAGVAGDDAEIDLRLAEARGVGGDPDRAGHRQLAAAAEREAVDRGNDRLAEVLDQIEDVLTCASHARGRPSASAPPAR